jgi:hypothetical protein
MCKLFFKGLCIIPHWIFLKYCPFKVSSHQAVFRVQVCFIVFLVLHANSENTLKVFYRSWRIRQKYLIVFGRMREKSLSAHGDCGHFRAVLDIQSRLQIRRKYLVYIENKLKGTVSRNFLLLVLFMNQFPPNPRVFQ